MKIEMKIGHYVKHIGKNDLILDNGACIQVVTQEGGRSGWIGHYPLPMSKKLFRELKKVGFVYLDEKTTKINSKGKNPPSLIYFRFDIDKMIASGGYKVVEE